MSSLQSPSVFNSTCNLTIPNDNPACLNEDLETYTLEGGNGPTTGNCIPDDDGNGRCEIYGWCETEIEDDDIT